ncbi:hypothetical protein PZ895_10420 [Mesorhizobium sp. YIM 152430]|uniref:AI-2E family transporter n=1 Tax=Mesorhizobium sp. YIM 152430 TaxID=3031761 RepID=UPI0023D9F7D6|nr:hypothetical protein [Mesorhizobium sp. YIM 152430]MDF1600187.1 hypothetical protein [Mesorhizobium sp. YIM 152430]
MLYVARLFLLPIVMSVLFALTLSPMVRVARRRGIPNAITASGLVVTVSFLAIAAVYLLSGPVVSFIDRAPIIMLEVNRKLEHLRAPLENVSRASEQLSELSAGESDPLVQDVRIQEPGLIVEAADEMLTVGGIALVTIVLTLFLLVYNTLIYEKIVQAVPRFYGHSICTSRTHLAKKRRLQGSRRFYMFQTCSASYPPLMLRWTICVSPWEVLSASHSAPSALLSAASTLACTLQTAAAMPTGTCTDPMSMTS